VPDGTLNTLEGTIYTEKIDGNISCHMSIGSGGSEGDGQAQVGSCQIQSPDIPPDGGSLNMSSEFRI
jgi:hypothetical protein